MKAFLPELHLWRQRFAHGPLLLFLDYDGTLAPIAPTPAEASLSPRMRDVLRALAGLPKVRLAVVSGRSLDDVRRMVSVRGIVYVGSHGIEFADEDARESFVPRYYLRQLAGLRHKLIPALRGIRGILFEEKPFSFAVHYRKASFYGQHQAEVIVRNICREPCRRALVGLMAGKKVLEIIPPSGMDKGKAVARLTRLWWEPGLLPVYVGDDLTDESAFMALKGQGLTVRVGPRRASAAAYYLPGVENVRMLLTLILYFRTAGTAL